MVYELRCYTLVPGKMPEYLKAAETIGRPARGNNFGVNHGYWTAEFGALNQIWHLWKYDSLNDRERLRGHVRLREVERVRAATIQRRWVAARILKGRSVKERPDTQRSASVRERVRVQTPEQHPRLVVQDV